MYTPNMEDQEKFFQIMETEFKNQLFTEVATELGVEYKCYTPPYHPQSNGRIEGFHSFLNACIV